MSQLDIRDIVNKLVAAEAALPGYIDKAIASITAAEGNVIGNFILSHVGVSDPKAAEEELITTLKTVKAIIAQGAEFVAPFLQFLLSLQPAKPGVAA
jgi:hypothetical protein